MPVTDSQRDTVRSWIGEEWDPEDEAGDIDDRYDKFLLQAGGDISQALYFTTVEIMRTQLSRMTNDIPSSMSIEGMSQTWVTNLTTLRENVKKLESGAGVEVGHTTGISPQTRCSPR